ncbi:MAG: hypothetical protein WBA17_13130 [Saprospiraceae bacterium]
MRTYPFFLASLFFVLVLSFPAPARAGGTSPTAVFSFYTVPIKLTYDPGMLIDEPRTLDNVVINSALRQLKRQDLDVLGNQLQLLRGQIGLNDFLYFRLIEATLFNIYRGKSPNARNLTLFQLLADADFDVRLTFRGNRSYVNVYTNEDLFEVPIIDDDGRTYANITCLNGDCSGKQSLYIAAVQPNPRGRSFSFALRSWPSMPSRPTVRTVNYTYHGIDHQMDVEFDQNMVDIMKDYPFIDEYCYLDTPLSPTLARSLVPQLRYLMAPLSTQQRLELLASFTRSGFAYKEDNDYFGHSKPMVPEELFGYAYSDCEDRSALFYALVRELIDVPMAVIAFDDHLSIAVATDDIPGDAFTIGGRRFVFVDPTGPSNSSRIGLIPPGYENKKFEIIGQWK